MKPKKKKINHAKKTVPTNRRQAIDPLMMQKMQQMQAMQQQPNEEQGEQGQDNEGMEGGMGGMQQGGQPPAQNYKGRNF